MISQDGWFDWMERRPGPSDKIYSQRNAVTGLVPHSAVGYYPGWASRLFSTERLPNGQYTDYAAASVHIWNPYAGVCYQHYPITDSCWGSGSRFPNTNFVSMECEGGPPGNESEPLTDDQIDVMIRVMADLSAWKGGIKWSRPASPTDTMATLYEHNECRRWGSVPTACPSSRIPWEEVLGMTTSNPTDRELHERRAKAELDIALLFRYRTSWVQWSGSEWVPVPYPLQTPYVELLDNSGMTLAPRVIIDVTRL